MEGPLLFGKYCLLERISVGGMAEVFRAKPLNAPDPDHYFAVKRILPHLAEDVEFIKMFVDEARLTVQLDHDNIVQTYELGQFQSSHYIVMEFVAGKDLLAFQKHVRNQGTILDVDMACHIVREVAKGLDYAHNKTDDNGDHLGIIHRDVSPQNVLVSWDGRVRVIDFGIAKATSQSTKTKAGVMKGKFGYMSPEQVQGEEIDHRSDIFAMGTLLWELLTNQRLFKAGNQIEAMTMIGDPDVDPPSSINAAVPPEVDAICMKMLEADPDERYHWGTDIADDIEAYLSNQQPPFHGSQLTTWVRDAFYEDFDEEKQKRRRFRTINRAEDVRKQSAEAYGTKGTDADEEAGDATGVWDVDEAPDSDADLEHFVSDHTVVQAGGLDLSDYDEWDDAPDTIDETEDVVEARIDDATQEALPRAEVKIAASSRYEAPETVVTGEHSSPPATQTGRQQQAVASTPADEQGATASVQPQSITTAPTPPQGTAEPDAVTPSSLNTPDSVTSGGETEAVSPEAGEASSTTSATMVVAAVAVLTVMVLAAAALYVTGGDSESDVVADTGEMLLEVEPVGSELEVFVDDQWVGDEAPLGLRGLDAGVYDVEIDHRDHPSWSGEVTVEPGEVAILETDLDATGILAVQWGEDTEELALFVDGEPVDIGGDQSSVDLERARGEYLVEAFSGDDQTFRDRVVVNGDQTRDVAIDWTSAGRLTLRGDEDRPIRLDGELWAEELPVTLTDLRLDHVYEFAAGDDELTLGYPELGMSELNVEELSEFEVRDTGDYGEVIIDIGETGPWSVIIDDVETGLVVPFEDVESLPVAAGERRIALERGGERFEYEVRVVGGETTRFRVTPGAGR